MVVEHSFVTTVDHAECFAQIFSFLRGQGFRHFSSPQDELKFQRGLDKPKNFSHLEDLPQTIAIHFDRGRINMAASIAPFRKPSAQHQQYLLILATAIERQACAVDDHERAERQVEDAQRLVRCSQSFGAIIEKRRFRRNVSLFVLFLLVGVIIALIVFAILFQ